MEALMTGKIDTQNKLNESYDYWAKINSKYRRPFSFWYFYKLIHQFIPLVFRIIAFDPVFELGPCAIS